MGIRSDGSHELGAGFLEKVYERAMIHELAPRGVSAKAQVSFPISYKGQCLGEYLADLVVGEKVIVELKCVDRFANEHLAQCINYLKASRLSVALLINFQKPKVEWKCCVKKARIAPCCAKDEGRPFGAALVGGGSKLPEAASVKSRGGERFG